jgi:hypothetical protein
MQQIDVEMQLAFAHWNVPARSKLSAGANGRPALAKELDRSVFKPGPDGFIHRMQRVANDLSNFIR